MGRTTVTVEINVSNKDGLRGITFPMTVTYPEDIDDVQLSRTQLRNAAEFIGTQVSRHMLNLDSAWES
jgi:hypothetical protein